MSDAAAAWRATVVVRPGSEPLAARMERALRPESEREVPRARAELHRSPPDTVVLEITARDTGAMRAALNTYLGWVHLAAATARAAERDARAAGPAE